MDKILLLLCNMNYPLLLSVYMDWARRLFADGFSFVCLFVPRVDHELCCTSKVSFGYETLKHRAVGWQMSMNKGFRGPTIDPGVHM